MGQEIPKNSNAAEPMLPQRYERGHVAFHMLTRRRKFRRSYLPHRNHGRP